MFARKIYSDINNSNIRVGGKNVVDPRLSQKSTVFKNKTKRKGEMYTHFLTDFRTREGGCVIFTVD